VGRHSGAPCTACQDVVLVRDGRFIEHLVHFDRLGRSMVCVGSHARPPRDWLDEAQSSGVGERESS
jgi:hypothetical protein